MIEHNGSFETPEGGYGGEYTLEDGTIVNVVTVFTGPGLAADTELEADRPLTGDEQDRVMDLDCDFDHADQEQIEYNSRQVQHRF